VNVAKEIMVPKVLAKNSDHKPESVRDIGPNGVLLAKDIVNIVLEDGSDEK
jgi:hypothetical protein